MPVMSIPGRPSKPLLDDVAAERAGDDVAAALGPVRAPADVPGAEPEVEVPGGGIARLYGTPWAAARKGRELRPLSPRPCPTLLAAALRLLPQAVDLLALALHLLASGRRSSSTPSQLPDEKRAVARLYDAYASAVEPSPLRSATAASRSGSAPVTSPCCRSAKPWSFSSAPLWPPSAPGGGVAVAPSSVTVRSTVWPSFVTVRTTVSPWSVCVRTTVDVGSSSPTEVSAHARRPPAPSEARGHEERETPPRPRPVADDARRAVGRRRCDRLGAGRVSGSVDASRRRRPARGKLAGRSFGRFARPAASTPSTAAAAPARRRARRAAPRSRAPSPRRRACHGRTAAAR